MANPFNPKGTFSSSQNKLANLISVRLDEKNFKKWKQQVSGVIQGFSLQKFITDPVVPKQSTGESRRVDLHMASFHHARTSSSEGCRSHVLVASLGQDTSPFSNLAHHQSKTTPIVLNYFSCP
jgi:hypothetical protein